MCMNGICECGAAGLSLVQHKTHTTKRDERPPHNRQDISGGSFRRMNSVAVCVAALLTSRRAAHRAARKGGRGLEGGFYLWFVWLKNGSRGTDMIAAVRPWMTSTQRQHSFSCLNRLLGACRMARAQRARYDVRHLAGLGTTELRNRAPEAGIAVAHGSLESERRLDHLLRELEASRPPAPSWTPRALRLHRGRRATEAAAVANTCRHAVSLRPIPAAAVAGERGERSELRPVSSQNFDRCPLDSATAFTLALA